MKLEDEQLIRRYLLGELDEQELTQVETRLMTDDDFDSHVQLIEDELIEEYVYKELNAQERETFKQRLLAAPEVREKVEFATAFKTYIQQVPEPEPVPAVVTQTIHPKPAPLVPQPKPTSWFDALAAFWKAQKALAAFSLATVVLLLTATIWLAIRNERTQNRLRELEAQQAAFQAESAALTKERDEANARATKAQDETQAINQEKDKLVQELAGLKKTEKKTGETVPLGDSVIAMLQPLDDTRSSSSGNGTPLTLDKPNLELRLKVTQNIYKSFSATVRKRGDSLPPFELTSSDVKRGRSYSLVILKISASQLTDGKYEIALTGTTPAGKTESVDSYAFSVRKNP
jgi:anti-sigma-K factor RskA